MEYRNSSGLQRRAEELREKAAGIKPASLMLNPAAGLEVVGELAGLLVDMGAQIDALTPYLDEGAAHGNAA